MNKESISLRFKQGSSDKVYNVTLEAQDGQGWLVNFAYGRYGKSLKSGTKTAAPIPFDRAKKAYDKLVTSKTAKGYTPDADGTPFTAPQITGERTNLYPQLLNEITLKDIPQVLEDFGGRVAMQIKHDGERRIVSIEEGIITGSNRRALKVGMHPRVVLTLQDLAHKLCTDLVLDCEDMGASLVIFDVLEFGRKDLRDEAFEYRTQFLKAVSGQIAEMYMEDILICDIPTIHSNQVTIELTVNHARTNGEEGVVLRDLRAQYSIGRPNSGGPCLKLKNWNSASFVVESIHPTKRSIGLGLWKEGSSRQKHDHIEKLGNCTVPTNYPIPGLYEVVEIKYLYAYPGGSIYQPQYKGMRSDLTTDAAILSQLRYKK